ncbi:putative reductase [Endogone sp. FLAS-F59071]|nr:putative reductase [Endogone sp. FLAS-F59071]|eukprot:RUS17616.1 putative reductase [Endogone sp. FLAS-F59071]
MALTLQATHTLNDGRAIPALGFGVYQVGPGDEAVQVVLWALEAGYRHIDTAAAYGNEENVGEAIRKRCWKSLPQLIYNNTGLCCPLIVVSQEKRYFTIIFHVIVQLAGHPTSSALLIWVTTKLWDECHGYDNAISAFEFSLEKLGLDYVDLYLIHSPYPGKKLRTESWKALEELHKRGLVKSIVCACDFKYMLVHCFIALLLLLLLLLLFAFLVGVSNYGIHHLQELLSICTIKPVVNQIEITPYLTREALVNFCRDNDIRVEAYSPLTLGQKLNDPTLVSIARQHGKQPAQILIRWSLQRGLIPLPKSVNKQRIVANADVFGWEISEEAMEVLGTLNEGFVTEWDPTTCE